jgi:hypothetical protein
VEYEQHGEDRAKYGENLLKKLAKSLNRRGLGERRLYEYRLTYQVYPQLGSIVLEYVIKNGQDEILRLSTAISVTPQEDWQTSNNSLFYKLSATHLIYLSKILHNPITLEFLGMESHDPYTETKLETAILNNLQRFIMEMGRGFCFEHRQKRIICSQQCY